MHGTVNIKSFTMIVLSKSNISRFIFKRKINFVYKFGSTNYLLYSHLQMVEINAFQESACCYKYCENFILKKASIFTLMILVHYFKTETLPLKP